MNAFTKSFLLFLTTLLLMVIVNESRRSSLHVHNFKIYGADTMNDATYDTKLCTWACHNSTTAHCKVHHAKSISPYFKWIDPVYFIMIKGLHGTGDYGLANIVLLAFLWPLLICFLFIKIIQMRKDLKHG